MRRFLGVATLAVVALSVVLIGSASGAGPTYSNGFETDTAGWLDNSGTIAQRASGYSNPGGYADTVSAAQGGNFAGLGRGPCVVQVGGGGDTVYCSGPFTRWGGYNATWTGGYTTQVDIYLDAVYAQANADTYGGNLTGLTPPTGDAANPVNKGTRFDYTSAINKAGDAGPNGHLRDFGFNVSTGYANDGCDGFMITGQTNVNRVGANPNIGQHQPQCIAASGWYTFKHTFSEDAGYLKVLMEIIPVSSATAVASWTITGIDPIATVGCNRYGWFSNQEIFGLPIDNASMTGCGTPPVTTATLNVTKFYDANADGVKNGSEPDITGWKVQVANGSTQSGTTPFTASGLAPGDYTATESSPSEPNWYATTPTSVVTTLAAGDDKSVSFGNVCTGDGGGLTIGFWGNKNGQALIEATQLALLTSLNLVNANGSPFNPTSNTQVKNWLSKATATNMAYMLSAQLAAMELNVSTGKVDGSALVYAPGVNGANPAGFITVDALMAEANAALGADGETKSGDPNRSYQETLKNALDQANQDTSTVYVQSGPCAFSFPGPICNAGTGNTGALYNAIPTDVGDCAPPSLGFEATGTNEFGDEVTLDPTTGTIGSLTVDFQSYACNVSGEWQLGQTDPCVSTPGATFPVDLTANIYAASSSGVPGALLGSVTLNDYAMPYRPSADATNCPGGAQAGIEAGSRWFNPAFGTCQFSISELVTFDFTTPIDPPTGTVIWTVAFNTETAGYSPTGVDGPYDSLNVGVKSYPNAPYAGTDVSEDTVFWSYSGNSDVLGDEAGWAGFRPLGQIAP